MASKEPATGHCFSDPCSYAPQENVNITKPANRNVNKDQTLSTGPNSALIVLR